MKYRDNEYTYVATLAGEPSAAYPMVNYFERANQGIDKRSIQNVLAHVRMTVNEMIDILPISIDTYKRKKDFDPKVTEKVLEIEEVYNKGLSAFGEGFYDWMNALNPSFGGVKPKSLLINSFGVRRLLSEIGRMEHGVLA